MPVGFTLPFQPTTGSLGLFQMTEDEFSAVTNDIRSLLVTNWGERPMRYNFGCNLREFLFEPKTGGELRQKIADRVLSQLSLWLPFVIVDELNVLFSEDDPSVPENGIKVRITFRLTSKPELDPITQSFIVDQSGGQ
jgi:phage baseplate assembly protein W